MATISIGDIHGHLAALDDLLVQVRHEAGKDDVVVFLGDYIDRGPDSRGCVDAILDFRRDTEARVVCLEGNHEQWMLRTQADYARHSWLLGMEAFDTVRSYSPEAARVLREAAEEAGARLYLDRVALPYARFFDAIPASHRAFFADLALYYDGPDCLCSHGGLNPRAGGLAAQSPERLIWGDTTFPDEYAGDRTLVYGHRDNAALDSRGWPHPRFVGKTIGIDTISHGVLTAIRLPDGQIFQSARFQP